MFLQICSSDLQNAAIGNLEFDNPQLSSTGSDAPDIRSVQLKGLGLSSLRESLALFSGDSKVDYPADSELSTEERKTMYDIHRQHKLESDSIQSIVSRWRREFDSRQKAGIDNAPEKRLGPLMNQWHSDLMARIQEELKLISDAETGPVDTAAKRERRAYGVFLRAHEADKLAALTILATMGIFSKLGMDKGVKLAQLATSIGRDVQDELIAETTLKKYTEAGRRNAVRRVLLNRKDKQGRPQWQALVRKLYGLEPEVFWPPSISVKVGAVLMSLLFEVAKTPVMVDSPEGKGKVRTMQPAFNHSYQIHWGKRVGLIHLHDAVIKVFTREPSSDVLGRQLPMVCKPKPWEGMKDGGYLLYQNSIVRSTPGETLQPAYVSAALEKGGLEQLRRGLDVLGTTGWVINREVFDVMVEAWNTGDPVGNLAPLEPDLPIPPRPSPEAAPEAHRNWTTTVREIENTRSGYHSTRCFQNFQLEVARAYRDEEFFLPHNIDFRGRAYPMAPYLNQMNADNSRGLLLFSEAKPLGENGLRWLKIQLANLAGYDKASFSEREQFAMDHLDDILDSADKGLHGRRWWLRAEDPWQCLAACIELKHAMRLPDPTQHLSRLPIHQDGSCNGLQHYAALGGDLIGAQQVNLEPSDRPSDVYTGVAEFVRDTVAREAAQGNPTAQLLDGKISRKIVKQTVMTNVYGVTFIGAVRQVRKQLVDHYPWFNTEEKITGSVYVAGKIFEALSTMFTGAHEIQYWLGDCASRIVQSLSPEQIEDIAKEALSEGTSKTGGPGAKTKDPVQSFQTTVIWTTPLGLPVVQPYRTRKSRRIKTSLQDLSIVDNNSEHVVSRRKQLQAFPPNFIHSLDATHMLLSANACRKAGLTFSAVHDSFWTHAGDVDTMNQILREAFVRMHSDDVIKRLAEEFRVRYGNHLFLAKVPTTGKLGRAIRTLRRGHRGGRRAQTHELLEEYKRQKLLKSDDPELQEQGRAMKTAASIYEEMGGTEKDLVTVTSLGISAMGKVPEDPVAAARRPGADGLDTSDPAIQSLFPGLEMTEQSSSETLENEEPDMGGQPGPEEEDEKPKKKTQVQHTWLWLPMNFRDIPAKGEWDLTRIRNSQYFFS